MGFFSSSRQDAQVDEQATEEKNESFLEASSSQGSALTPFEMEAKERRRQLEALRQRASRLTNGFNQMEQLIADSEKSADELASFIDQSRHFVENEKRLKVENTQLSKDNEEKSYKLQSLTTQLEKRNAEIEALKSRNNEYRATIDKARAAIAQLREKEQALLEDIDKKNSDLLGANVRNQEIGDSLEQLSSKYNLLEEEHTEMSIELDTFSKHEGELQQKLSENTALLDEEVRKSKIQASELEANKRELSETNVRYIDLKSEHEALLQEVEYLKNAREDDQRKYDNRVFSMKSEIDSMTSERRIAQQTLHELKSENSQLKKSTREAESSIQRQKTQLNALQKSLDRDRKSVIKNNEKLSDLNLRYNSALTDLNHEQRQREIFQQKIEKLTDENGKLREYRDKYENVSNQVADLKGLVAEYQQLLESGRAAREPDYGLSSGEEDDLDTVAPEIKTLQ